MSMVITTEVRTRSTMMISQILKTISMRKEGMMTKIMMTMTMTTTMTMMMTTMTMMMTMIIGAEVQEAEAEVQEAEVKTGIVREDLLLVEEEVLEAALVEDPVLAPDLGQEEAEDLQDQGQDQDQTQEDQDQIAEEAQETPIQDRAETVVQEEGVVQAPVQEAAVALILTPGQEVATEVLIQEGEHQKEVLLQ